MDPFRHRSGVIRFEQTISNLSTLLPSSVQSFQAARFPLSVSKSEERLKATRKALTSASPDFFCRVRAREWTWMAVDGCVWQKLGPYPTTIVIVEFSHIYRRQALEFAF